MTPRFIGIDAAATTGYAFIGCAGPPEYKANHWICGTVRADSPQKYDVLAHAVENGVTHAVIEEPMPFAGSHAGVASAMNRSYGRWLEACERAGLVVVPALVVHWQTAMLTAHGVRMKQDKEKRASIALAKLLGACVRNGDEADAVCLASYGQQAMRRAAEKVEEKKQARAKTRAKHRKQKPTKTTP